MKKITSYHCAESHVALYVAIEPRNRNNNNKKNGAVQIEIQFMAQNCMWFFSFYIIPIFYFFQIQWLNWSVEHTKENKTVFFPVFFRCCWVDVVVVVVESINVVKIGKKIETIMTNKSILLFYWSFMHYKRMFFFWFELDKWVFVFQCWVYICVCACESSTTVQFCSWVLNPCFILILVSIFFWKFINRKNWRSKTNLRFFLSRINKATKI